MGSHYEVSGGVVKKHYYAGGARVALRDNGTLRFLLSDHLSGTNVTTTDAGAFYASLRYHPWGTVRYANGSTPTKYQYTGQYSFAGEFGLLDFKARYYDPQLGRFAAPDTIIPQGQGAQAWDRYAGMLNNPVRYTDPTGHWVDPCKFYQDGYCVEEDTGLTKAGARTVTVLNELRRLTNNQFDLVDLIRLVFERELAGWQELVSVIKEAAVRNYWNWSGERFGTHSITTLLNWLGGHNSVVGSLYTELFTNLPAGIKTLDRILGSSRDFSGNASSALEIARALLKPPDEWKKFDPDRPYTWGFCDISQGKCTIKLDLLRKFEGMTKNSYFSTDPTAMYYIRGFSYIWTYTQAQYWWGGLE